MWNLCHPLVSLVPGGSTLSTFWCLLVDPFSLCKYEKRCNVDIVKYWVSVGSWENVNLYKSKLREKLGHEHGHTPKNKFFGHAQTIFYHVVVKTRWPVIEPNPDWLLGAWPRSILCPCSYSIYLPRKMVSTAVSTIMSPHLSDSYA